MKKSLFLLFIAVFSFTAYAEDVTIDDSDSTNLFKNASFEDAGKTETQAAHWSNANYRPAIRTSEKAKSGKYSMKFVGDGKNYFGIRQIIDGASLKGKKKLEVSGCFFFEKDLKGHFLPLYFIVNADGKQHWPSGRNSKKSDPRGKWFKAGTTLDLTKYTNIKRVEIYTLGWKYGKNFFTGTAYIDDFEAYAE